VLIDSLKPDGQTTKYGGWGIAMSIRLSPLRRFCDRMTEYYNISGTLKNK